MWLGCEEVASVLLIEYAYTSETLAFFYQLLLCSHLSQLYSPYRKWTDTTYISDSQGSQTTTSRRAIRKKTENRRPAQTVVEDVVYLTKLGKPDGRSPAWIHLQSRVDLESSCAQSSLEHNKGRDLRRIYPAYIISRLHLKGTSLDLHTSGPILSL